MKSWIIVNAYMMRMLSRYVANKNLVLIFSLRLLNRNSLYQPSYYINTQVEEGNEIINKNMPFTSGNIKWSKELKGRIQTFWSYLSYLSHP